MSGLPSWVRKGALVVCVDDRRRTGRFYPSYIAMPPRGEIVTIAGVGTEDFDGLPVLVIAEYPNPDDHTGEDLGWLLCRFRPLVENASDSETETVLYRKRKDKLHQRVSTKSRERA